MQFVADKYYYWYNRAAIFIGLLFLAASGVSYFDLSAVLRGTDALLITTGVIAAAQVIYGTIIFRAVANRAGAGIAGLISSMLLTVNVLNLLHNSGSLQILFLAIWLIEVFLSAIFGIYAVAGVWFLVTLYFVLAMGQGLGTIEPGSAVMATIAATYLINLLGFVIWRRLYVGGESTRVRQLTGQLKSNQQQADILIQSITDGMIVITTEGKISLMNPAAAKMTGWGIDEAIGIDTDIVLRLTTEDGKDLNPEDNPFKRVFDESKTVDMTAQLNGKALKPITVSVVVSPVIVPKTKEVSGAVAVLRDISVARAEEKRRADFISTASHEMRTPVAAIEGYLALALNDKVSSIDSKARSFLEKAHSSTQHLGKLFQDLLTSARAEDGRLVNHPVVVEMGSYLEQLTDSLRFAAEKKGLLMDFIVGSEKGVLGDQKVIKPLYYVHVDPDRMREVITNLFDNAVKYTESGKISIGLTGNHDIIQIYIRDTGPGIPAEDIPHLFQKFYRVDSSTTRTIGGTGLGLFICRKIIELYKGRIWVESELDKGSTFYINLPRLDSQKAASLQAAEAAQSANVGLPSG